MQPRQKDGTTEKEGRSWAWAWASDEADCPPRDSSLGRVHVRDKSMGSFFIKSYFG